jgi:GGDEF domain-containing protein
LNRYPPDVEPKTRNVIFRYGGDEFIVLAFNTSMYGGTDEITRKKVDSGFGMAQALQRKVSSIDVHALVGEYEKSDTPSKVTVSAGVADTNPAQEPDDTVAALTRRAERALLAAKQVNAKATQAAKEFNGTVVPYKPELEPSQGQTTES